MNIGKICDYSEYLEKPYDDDHDNHDVEDGFDLMIHWDIGVDKPENKACNDQ